ncbi:Hypothetical predicted protein [Olea europaea subsp. europaea]|uniref:Uncharacterized protein n=1 Tax=Olea europaea subsp. europaea TaxID=158383 RepID=A0A8S0US87_OLEEU|nr:Hypothetical predicted protein [Olea europaea subsp. europaea]
MIWSLNLRPISLLISCLTPKMLLVQMVLNYLKSQPHSQRMKLSSYLISVEQIFIFLARFVPTPILPRAFRVRYVVLAFIAIVLHGTSNCLRTAGGVAIVGSGDGHSFVVFHVWRGGLYCLRWGMDRPHYLPTEETSNYIASSNMLVSCDVCLRWYGNWSGSVVNTNCRALSLRG